tara:strand:- start:1097 stop:1288 length:192 start_codon:yes stop_codon:yes gene_type:complete
MDLKEKLLAKIERLEAKIERLEASKIKLVRTHGCARDKADMLKTIRIDMIYNIGALNMQKAYC